MSDATYSRVSVLGRHMRQRRVSEQGALERVEVAADRALQLMSILQTTTEELALAKLQLQYYKERDALQAEVCSLNSRTRCHCSETMPPLLPHCCCVHSVYRAPS